MGSRSYERSHLVLIYFILPLSRVNHELSRVISDPETRDWAERYFTPVDAGGAGTLAGLREFVRTEMAVWGKAIETIGLKAE